MLEQLVDDPQEVLTRWPRVPQRYHRDPDTFRRFLTLQEVDALVDAECLAMRNVALLKDSVITEPFEYVGPSGDMPRTGAIRKHINDGGSISVRALERLKPTVNELHRELTRETGYLVHVNAYLTPPGNRGLLYHYDPYLTLILQLHGSKIWQAHDPFVENPVKEYASFHTEGWTKEQKHYLANTEPRYRFQLDPGDVLWLPRGYPHAPYTVGDETSLHITVAFKERTLQWVTQQLAGAVVNDALLDPAMRAEVAPADLVGDPRTVIAEARDYLVGALMQMDIGAVARQVQKTACR